MNSINQLPFSVIQSLSLPCKCNVCCRNCFVLCSLFLFSLTIVILFVFGLNGVVEIQHSVILHTHKLDIGCVTNNGKRIVYTHIPLLNELDIVLLLFYSSKLHSKKGTLCCIISAFFSNIFILNATTIVEWGST